MIGTVFFNATRGLSFEDTKKIICGRLGLNYNDIEIDITWRSLVGGTSVFLDTDCMWYGF